MAEPFPQLGIVTLGDYNFAYEGLLQGGYFFKLINGLDSSSLTLHYLALTAALIGAFMLFVKRGNLTPSIIISWLILVTVLLMAPFKNDLLFFDLNEKSSDLDLRKADASTPRVDSSASGDIDQTVFMPQVIAMDVMTRLHRTIFTAFFSLDGSKPRLRNWAADGMNGANLAAIPELNYNDRPDILSDIALFQSACGKKELLSRAPYEQSSSSESQFANMLSEEQYDMLANSTFTFGEVYNLIQGAVQNQKTTGVEAYPPYIVTFKDGEQAKKFYDSALKDHAGNAFPSEGGTSTLAEELSKLVEAETSENGLSNALSNNILHKIATSYENLDKSKSSHDWGPARLKYDGSIKDNGLIRGVIMDNRGIIQGLTTDSDPIEERLDGDVTIDTLSEDREMLQVVPEFSDMPVALGILRPSIFYGVTAKGLRAPAVGTTRSYSGGPIAHSESGMVVKGIDKRNSKARTAVVTNCAQLHKVLYDEMLFTAVNKANIPAKGDVDYKFPGGVSIKSNYEAANHHPCAKSSGVAPKFACPKAPNPSAFSLTGSPNTVDNLKTYMDMDLSADPIKKGVGHENQVALMEYLELLTQESSEASDSYSEDNGGQDQDGEDADEAAAKAVQSIIQTSMDKSIHNLPTVSQATMNIDRAMAYRQSKDGLEENLGTGGSFIGWVANGFTDILAAVDSFFKGAEVIVYMRLLRMLLGIILMFILVVTPLIYMMGLLIPSYAPGVLILSVISVVVLKAVPISFTVVDVVISYGMQVVNNTPWFQPDLDKSIMINIAATAYTSIVGVTLLLMFKLGDVSNIGKLASLDGVALGAADKSVGATKAIGATALASGATVGLGAVAAGAAAKGGLGAVAKGAVSGGLKQGSEVFNSMSTNIPILKEMNPMQTVRDATGRQKVANSLQEINKDRKADGLDAVSIGQLERQAMDQEAYDKYARGMMAGYDSLRVQENLKDVGIEKATAATMQESASGKVREKELVTKRDTAMREGIAQNKEKTRQELAAKYYDENSDERKNMIKAIQESNPATVSNASLLQKELDKAINAKVEKALGGIKLDMAGPIGAGQISAGEVHAARMAGTAFEARQAAAKELHQGNGDAIEMATHMSAGEWNAPGSDVKTDALKNQLAGEIGLSGAGIVEAKARMETAKLSRLSDPDRQMQSEYVKEISAAAAQAEKSAFSGQAKTAQMYDTTLTKTQQDGTIREFTVDGAASHMADAGRDANIEIFSQGLQEGQSVDKSVAKDIARLHTAERQQQLFDDLKGSEILNGTKVEGIKDLNITQATHSAIYDDAFKKANELTKGKYQYGESIEAFDLIKANNASLSAFKNQAAYEARSDSFAEIRKMSQAKFDEAVKQYKRGIISNYKKKATT